MEAQKMIILRKFALLFFWCLCYSFSFKGFAQDNKKSADKSFFLTTKPQSFFFGANIGAEVPLSSKISIGGRYNNPLLACSSKYIYNSIYEILSEGND